MDVELIPKDRTPRDLSSSQEMEQFAQRKHMVLDVEVASVDKGHLSQTKHVEQFARHKQLVMDIDVPTRERGHLTSSRFDATYPRIALLEDDLPRSISRDMNQGFATENRGHGNNTSSKQFVIDSAPSSDMPMGTNIKASPSPRFQDPAHLKSSYRTKGARANTPSKSRPSSQSQNKRGMSRGGQQEMKSEMTLETRPRFVGLPQGKKQQEARSATPSRKSSPLFDIKTPLRDESKRSSPSPPNPHPVSISGGRPSSPNRVRNYRADSRDRSHPGLNSSPEEYPHPVMEYIEEPFEGGHFSSQTTRQAGSSRSGKPLVPLFKKRSEPLKKTTTGSSPDSSLPNRGRIVKGKPIPPVVLTVKEKCELKLLEEAKKICEVHGHTFEVLPRAPSTVSVLPSKSPQQKSKSKQKKKTAVQASFEATISDDESGHECDIHLGTEQSTVAATQLKSGCHELSGNLAILPGDLWSPPDLDESRQQDIFYAESLERLIKRVEAFQQTLEMSSSTTVRPAKYYSEAALRPTADLDRKKSLELPVRLRDADESISSISRLLTHLLPEDDDDDQPKYARVTTLDNEKRVVEDLAEAENVKKLWSQGRKIKTSSQCEDTKPTDVVDTCEVHRDPPNQTVPVDDILLPRRKFPNFNDGPRGGLEKDVNTGVCVPLQGCCGVHGIPHVEVEKSSGLDLSLTLAVGKLVFEDLLVLRELGITHAQDSAFGPTMDESCSCLLTVSVPGLFRSAHKGLEQGLSISPVRMERKEACFGHKSELHWSGLRRDSLKLWMSQAMKVTATLMWDSGLSLVCEGSVFLGKVIESMPECYKTKLDLQRVTTQDANSLYMGKPRADDTPSARIEIEIFLVMEDVSGKAEVGAWLYISISSVTGCIPQPKKRGGIGRLCLVLKSDKEDDHLIPFLVNCDDNKDGAKTWKIWKRKQSDAVIPAPKQVKDATSFIEVWRDWRGLEGTRQDASENFIGLVKVPWGVSKVESFSSDKKGPGSGRKDEAIFPAKVDRKGVVAAEGDFAIWDPVKDVVCGSLGVCMVLGTKARMLKLQLQNRAARIIQSYAHCFTERIKAAKEECLLFGVKHNPFAEELFPDNYEEGVTRHVLEITVQHVTDLPANDVFQGADSASCEGAFIKYSFPCDGEPFYTNDMRWGRTIFFSASVHHGIILPNSESLEAHLMKMNAFSMNSGDLLFELWGCFTDNLDSQKYLLNKLKLTDTSWDMKREKDVKSTRGQGERLLGTSRLLQKNLLHMISEKRRRSFYSSPVVRKKFYLPVQVDMSQLQTYKRAPTLVVQVAYFILNIEDRKAHMVDTIFSGTQLHEDSLVEATLEIEIFGVTGLQNVVHEVETSSMAHATPFEGLNSYVRYSVFPSNRQLELIYPPGTTSIKANDLVPQYRWIGELKIIVNVQVLRELRTRNMRFEVWHRSYSHTRTKFRPMVLSEESSATDMCLGAASIPTVSLLHSKQGITGWHNLSRKGVVVGAVEVAVCFKNWRVRPL